MKQPNGSKHVLVMVVAAMLLNIVSVAATRVMAQGPGVISHQPPIFKPPKIYAFLRGAAGKLNVNFWNGSKWHWADQGTPGGTAPPMTSPSAEMVGSPGVISYQDSSSQPQRIYAFVRGKVLGVVGGTKIDLFVRYWNGSKWQWAHQGTPQGVAALYGTPGVITYRERGPEQPSRGIEPDFLGPRRIYAFVRGANGHLYVNWWDGFQWRWADQGQPPGTTMSGSPSVITYQEKLLSGGYLPQRIYAFVRGTNGKLYVNWWNGNQWQWADQGQPPGTTVVNSPGVTTYKPGVVQPQRIYAFVQGANGHLYVNWWDGNQWQWADQGQPPGTTTSGSPGVIAYRAVGPSPPSRYRIYAFVRGANGKLYVNFWNSSQWRWADQGTPKGTTVVSSPGVITYREKLQTAGFKPRRIYAFVRGADGKLHVNFWNSSQWQWANQGPL